MPEIRHLIKKISEKSFLWLEKVYRGNKVNFTVVYSLGLLAAIWKIITALPADHQPFYTDLIVIIPLAYTAFHFIFFLAYKYVGRRLISYSGIGRHDVRYSFEQLTNGAVKAVEVQGDINFMRLEFSDYLKKKFTFPVTKTEKRITGEINYIAFSDTIWSGKNPELNAEAELDGLTKKIKRNTAHLTRNYKSILLIKNSVGDLIGFTHIIPVSTIVWEKYLRGEIADVTFADYNVCTDQEMAYGLIIFSIGKLYKSSFRGYLPSKLSEHLSSDVIASVENERVRRQAKTRRDLDVDLSAIFKGVLYQINELIQQNFAYSKIVPVLVQIEDEDLRKLFVNNNFIKHPTPSKDGYDIYTAHLIVNKKVGLVD